MSMRGDLKHVSSTTSFEIRTGRRVILSGADEDARMMLRCQPWTMWHHSVILTHIFSLCMLSDIRGEPHQVSPSGFGRFEAIRPDQTAILQVCRGMGCLFG